MRGRLLAAALIAAAPLLAPPPAAAFQAEAPPADALALARLVTPPETYVEMAVKGGRTGFLGGSEADPDAKALEQRYPGIYADAWKALEPEMRRMAIAAQPAFERRLAALYARLLTPAELTGLRAFYASPTGRKLIRVMHANLDMAPMLDDAVSRPDAQVSAEALAAAQAEAKRKALAALTSDDEAALAGLARLMPLAKLQSVAAAVQKFTLETINEPQPEAEARMQQVVEARMTAFIAARDGTD